MSKSQKRRRSSTLLVLSFTALVAIASPLEGNRYHTGPDAYYDFENGVMTSAGYFGAEQSIRLYDYRLEWVDMIPFMTITRGGESERRMILFSDGVLVQYNGAPPHDRGIIGFTAQAGCWREEMWFRRYPESVSSYLTEGSTEYAGRNIGLLSNATPWVEGVEGWGIGETITFPAATVGRMQWSGGFVSYEKPYLYGRNGRPKRIRATDSLNDEEWIFDLEDTPNLQELNLQATKDRKLTVEILDVYRGTHYEDTCVNFVFFERCAAP